MGGPPAGKLHPWVLCSCPGDHVSHPEQQLCILQFWVSLLEPAQPDPPQAGDGLVQVRVRDWVPPPQEAEQLLQSLQGLLQPPLTAWLATHAALVQ